MTLCFSFLAFRRLVYGSAMTLVLALLLAAPLLTTTAEQTELQRTGRYDEVVALCFSFEARFKGRVRCETYGQTPEGRPMLALVAVKKKGLPVVFFQGAIHAGEMDGKDAGFWVMRELLEGKALPGALDEVGLVFVPVFNVDGHERFGPHQRPNQNGPPETGWRTTSQNLNLNRDYAKAEAPEMAAMLRLLEKYDPILHVDLHVTDGAKFQHDVSLMVEPTAAGPVAMREVGKQLRERVFAELEQKGHLPVPFYPSFIQHDEPSSGFAYAVPPPRFGLGYWMQRNRFAVLVEAHSWKDYPTRVKTARNVLLAFIGRAASDGRAWLEAAKAAEAQATEVGGKDFVLSYEHTQKKKTLRFLGYAYEKVASEVSGKQWIRYDDGKPQVWEVPYYDEVAPKTAVRAPKAGYVVPASHAGWVGEKLALHGIRFEVVRKARPKVALEVFRATAAKFRSEPFEGRQMASLEGRWAAESRDVPQGSLFVPVAQPKSALVMHLFEPLAPDSLAAWGFFNAHFEQKEYMEDYVAEEEARKMLADPAIKAAFDERLKDPAFAKSPEQRLRFFYARHPAFDERWNLYPVYRADAW